MGTWVVVSVEKIEQDNVFVMPVENRNAEALVEIIQTHIATGFRVHTDC
jgi:hypothetical protein